MNPTLMAITLAIAVLAFSMAFSLAVPYFGRNIGHGYKPTNHFPYELMEGLSDVQRRYVRIPLFIGALAVVSFFYGAYTANGIFLTYVILALALLAMVAWILLFYVKTRVVERHLLIASLFMMLVLLLDFIVAYYLFMTPFNDVFAPWLVYGILALGIGEMVLMLNPRLKKWSQLETKTENGTASFIRPRYFVLPLSEWLTFLNVALVTLLTFVSIYL